MAYTLAMNDILEVKVGSGATGQAGINVLHFQVTAVTGASLTDVAAVTLLDAIFAPLYKPLLANNATYYGTRMQRIFPTPPTLAQVWAGNAGVGTNGAVPLPTQVSGIITLQTNLAGRAYRGRMYIPFPSTSANDPVLDTPVAAYQTALNNLALQVVGARTLTSGANSVTISNGIYHRIGHTITPTSAWYARLKWATQRKRGNYGRPNVYPPF